MNSGTGIESLDQETGLPYLQFALVGNQGLRLAACRWLPAGNPPAVVVFAHGYTAHMGSYANVRRALVADGFIVYALDHRGHGYSQGRRASLDRFDDLVDDFERLVALTKADWPGLPVFTLGHSMGGLVVARHAQHYQEGLAGMVAVSAAFVVGGHVSDQAVKLLITMSRLFPTLPVIGDEQVAPASDRPRSVRRKRDILQYHGRVRLNMARELRQGGLDAMDQAPAWRLPVLFQHGTADPVTSPEGSEQAFQRAASTDRSLDLWPERRHNLLTDDGWEEPVAQISRWMHERSAPPS